MLGKKIPEFQVERNEISKDVKGILPLTSTDIQKFILSSRWFLILFFRIKKESEEEHYFARQILFTDTSCKYINGLINV